MVYIEPQPKTYVRVTVEDWNQDVVENVKALRTQANAIPIVPTGTIVAYAGATAPSGWVPCDGMARSRTTQAALFAVIGTLYGAGDGSTTFNVPDLRGRFPLGMDNMGTGPGAANRVTASQADNLGQGSGAENHTLTISELPAHDHGIKQAASSAGANPNLYAGNLTGAASGQMQGGGAAHNNMPPYQTILYIIKL